MIETSSAQCGESAGVYYMPHSGVWKSNKAVHLRLCRGVFSTPFPCQYLGTLCVTAKIIMSLLQRQHSTSGPHARRRFRRVSIRCNSATPNSHSALNKHIERQYTELAERNLANLLVHIQLYRGKQFHTSGRQTRIRSHQIAGCSAIIPRWTHSIYLLGFLQCVRLTKKDIVSQINSVYDPIDLGWTITSSAQINDARNIRTKIRLENNPCSTYLREMESINLRAIAACAYLQGQTTNLVSPLICGKTKLTPKKTRQTIPRLELVGILMAK
ncbi:hypothetical protein OSTOST_18824 [Ostertagia ostertagi]